METELKFEIKNNQIQGINDKLQKIGFKNNGRVYELNVMFDNPKQIMQISNGRIRLRQSGDKVILTYKKPVTREGIKQEIEYEVEVADFHNMEKILSMMEFNKTTSYERYRTYYKKDSTQVMIDEFPYTNFIEIEGERNTIIKISQKLGFEIKDNLTESCDTIYTNRCIAQNIKPSKHILFNSKFLPK